MQYCSLQHPTLLLSPVTSTTGCSFRFGSVSSFFLELFLHSSPVAYFGHLLTWEFIFQCLIFLPFHTVHRWIDRYIEIRGSHMHAYSVAQSCPTFCIPMDCSLPSSFVHGIFQARKLVWVAIFSSRGSSHPRDQTHISSIFH